MFVIRKDRSDLNTQQSDKSFIYRTIIKTITLIYRIRGQDDMHHRKTFSCTTLVKFIQIYSYVYELNNRTLTLYGDNQKEF